MKIVQTPVRFYPYTGGVENHVYDLSKELVGMGHKVEVVCAATGEGSQDAVDGIAVNRLFCIGNIAQTNITPTLPWNLLKASRDADIIHTHLPTPWCADISAVVGELLNIPVVLTYHNDIVGDGMVNYIASMYNKSVLGFTLGSVERIIITQPNYLESSAYLSSFERKVDVVHNGIDIERFRPMSVNADEKSDLGFKNGRFNLFFLSVLDEYHEYKGLEILLRAMEELKSKMETPPHLVVGGDGALRAKYEQLANELGISGSVTFQGYIPESDLPKTYTAADSFVLPSTSSDQEGFGLVLLEALSCGTPVVSTEVVGVSDEISSAGIGKVVEPGSVGQLVEAIIELQSMHREASFGERCRTLCVNRFSSASMAEKTEKIYEEVIHSG